MGGDDSQKLTPWRGIYSSPGHSKPPAHSKINSNGKLRWGCRGVLRFLAKPGRGSATDCLGHFWKADLGHFSQAPKHLDFGNVLLYLSGSFLVLQLVVFGFQD